MKQIVVLFGLVTIVFSCVAQNPQNPPDLQAFINFSALSNSPPPDPALAGQANYFHIWLPPYPNLPTYTNRLEVYIGLPAQARDGWILAMQEDGSFTPVTELTNQYGGGTASLFYYQTVTLTTNQIYNLITGNLYAEIDFENGSYLGSLAPDYNFIHGPTATMIFPTAIDQGAAIGYTVISPNNRTAKFVLDGSHCVDPFYLPMQISWTGYDGYYTWGDASKILFTSTNVMVTHVFNLGMYGVSLQASDRLAAGNPLYFSVHVITAGQAVNLFIPQLQYYSPMTDWEKKSLAGDLSKAARFFNESNLIGGCDELEMCESLVKSYHFNNLETTDLLSPIQEVIDAVKRPR